MENESLVGSYWFVLDGLWAVCYNERVKLFSTLIMLIEVTGFSVVLYTGNYRSSS
ncbi:hypothetical protein [Paenibacillus assamensis]|uniref:hypothetical protein n=1 Tax=Paenibacillus assamensis TaxID=311244 RepID=UPI00146F1439|nr:hypothetical protein [Paenibacillus assamensis]